MKDFFEEVLQIINELRVDDFVILIGSWVELIYEENNIISDFQSNLKTKDIDFLIKNIRQPTESIDLLKGFTDKGFEIDISGFDVCRIIKDDYEIEFLARMIGGKYSYVKVPALKIPKVEALSHTSMLLEDTISTIYKSNNIIVPNPYCYILHKMIINNKRKDKMDKDKYAIRNLLIYLDSDDDKIRFTYYYNTCLSDKEKKNVKQFINENNLNGYFDLNE